MLRITRQTDYALVLLGRFALAERDARRDVEQDGGTDGPKHAVRTARELADVAAIPLPTVSKILKLLSRKGILASHRGVHGGYRLAREAASISVVEIIAAIDGPIALTECQTPETDPCSLETSCPTRGHWTRINQAVFHALAGLSLAEMVADGPAGARLVTVEPLSAPSRGRR